MKKIRNFVIGGIQQKVFNLVLYAITLIIAVYSVVILYQANRLQKLVETTSEQQKTAITDTTRAVMDDSISASLSDTTQLEADRADDMFLDLSGAVRTMADYAQKLFADPQSYPERAYAAPDASLDGQTTVQLLTDGKADLSDAAIRQKLALVANMSDLLVSLYENTRVTSCYIALPEGVMLLADNDSASKFSKVDGSLIPISITNRPWYVGAVENKDIYYSDVAGDIYTLQLGVMCGMPVYQDGRLMAVVGADLLVEKIARRITASGEDGRFLCIVNSDGHVVFSPHNAGFLEVKEAQEATDLRDSEYEALAAFVEDSLSHAAGPELLSIEGTNYYMCGAPIPSIGWTLLSGISQEIADQVSQQMIREYDNIENQAADTFTRGLRLAGRTILVLLLIATVLAAVGALYLAKRIVAPLGMITERVQSLSGSDLQFCMADEYRTGDEIEVLAESFASLSARTVSYLDQVTRVTAEKERIGAELNMATAIQASQLPRLFPAFPNRTEFEVYASMTPAREVGGDFYDFFLIDDNHIGLVMADVSGKGVPAALFMMVSRVLIKSHLQNGNSPAMALDYVNDQLCEGNETDLFVTVWLAVLEISTGRGVAANAGHEHPVIRRDKGEYMLEVYRHSPAVAVMEGVHFREHSFQLRPGDSLFVYTDGVAEATNSENELFGTDRMLEALNTDPDACPEDVLKNVSAGIQEFVKDAEQFDDITMLCLKYNGSNLTQDK